MTKILAIRHPLQVADKIVGLVSVFVIYLQIAIAQECAQNKTMGGAVLVFPIQEKVVSNIAPLIDVCDKQARTTRELALPVISAITPNAAIVTDLVSSVVTQDGPPFFGYVIWN
jgi:hypothetical protein